MEIPGIAVSMVSSQYFPLNFEGTSMRPNILLMCKLLFLLLVIHGFFDYMNDPYIPFFSIFDTFNNFPGVFKLVLRTTFIVSGILLIFNYKVRTMALILGMAVIVSLLASKPMFRNHLFICGCLFFLSGLTHKKDDPWLLYIQFSLIYLGAATNKIFQIDWWDGSFMQNWMINARENQLFISISKQLPELLFAKLLSWFSIFTEFCIGILLLFKKRHLVAVWAIILFHSILYTMTAFRFGHFFEDILIALLIFLNFPTDGKIIYYNDKILKLALSIFTFFSSPRKTEWIRDTNNDETWMEIQIGSRKSSNFDALRVLLMYSPLFYVSLFFIDNLIRILFNDMLMHGIHIFLMWCFILFSMPRMWVKIDK